MLLFCGGKTFLSSCLQQLMRGRGHTTNLSWSHIPSSFNDHPILIRHTRNLVCDALKIMHLSPTFSFLERNMNISQIFAKFKLMDFPIKFQILNITSQKKSYYISFISNFLLYLIRAIIIINCYTFWLLTYWSNLIRDYKWVEI